MAIKVRRQKVTPIMIIASIDSNLRIGGGCHYFFDFYYLPHTSSGKQKNLQFKFILVLLPCRIVGESRIPDVFSSQFVVACLIEVGVPDSRRVLLFASKYRPEIDQFWPLTLFFCLPFVNQVFDHRGRTLFSFVPSSNSLFLE